MKSYNDFILSLIEATRERKMKWVLSSVKGGYISKIADTGIEILPPSNDVRSQLNSNMAESLPESALREDLIAQREWRVVVYNMEGDREFMILESRLDTKMFVERLNFNITQPIKTLFDGIRYIIEETESKRLDNLTDKIKSL